MAKIAHNHGCLFHTDAVQAVGHIKINVHEAEIDLLSASAHKFNGPKEIGFLYKKRTIGLAPLIDGGRQEHGCRAGTENVAAIVGMALALKKNYDQIEMNAQYLYNLEEKLLERLNKYGADYIRNGGKLHTPGNISLSFRGFEGEAILHRLDLMGICVSTGSACDSVNTQLSHVLKAIKVPKEYAKGTIRISFGRDNTEEDIIRIADVLIKIIERKR